jgi:hypothetical protein
MSVCDAAYETRSRQGVTRHSLSQHINHDDRADEADQDCDADGAYNERIDHCENFILQCGHECLSPLSVIEDDIPNADASCGRMMLPIKKTPEWSGAFFIFA